MTINNTESQENKINHIKLDFNGKVQFVEDEIKKRTNDCIELMAFSLSTKVLNEIRNTKGNFITILDELTNIAEKYTNVLISLLEKTNIPTIAECQKKIQERKNIISTQV